jgi:hypothetical protein
VGTSVSVGEEAVLENQPDGKECHSGCLPLPLPHSKRHRSCQSHGMFPESHRRTLRSPRLKHYNYLVDQERRYLCPS